MNRRRLVFRGYLAAAEWKMFVNSLSGHLVDERIALTADERHLLDEVTGPGLSAKLPDLGTALPAYRCTPTGPEPGRAEAWLVSIVPRVPGVRRVLAAFRQPADSAAIPLPTWVYLVEADPGSDVAHLQGDLRVGDPARGVVESFRHRRAVAAVPCRSASRST
jgi:hypothetical protein